MKKMLFLGKVLLSKFFWFLSRPSWYQYLHLISTPPNCSEIDSEKVPRLTDGTDLEMQKKRGSRRSSRLCKSNSSVTWSLDLSDEEEIRASHVNDGNVVRKSRQQKKISRYSLVHYHNHVDLYSQKS